MMGKPGICGEINVALDRLVRDGVLKNFKTNWDAENIPGWVPEITIMISETADLARALEQVDAAVRPMGPVMVIWERADEVTFGDAASSLVEQKY
jgi:hypothetical protein